MVFHVAVTCDRVGNKALGELLENELIGLLQDVREDVESSAVCHAHDDLVDTQVRALLDDRVERRNERLGAFE